MVDSSEEQASLYGGVTPTPVFAVQMSLEDQVSEFHRPAQFVFSSAVTLSEILYRLFLNLCFLQK